MPFFVDGCHRNTKMLMPAKFHLRFASLRSKEVFFVQKVPVAIYCSWLSLVGTVQGDYMWE